MTFETEEIFTNGEACIDSEKNFKDIYHADLDDNDLFQRSIVYGRHCGIAGVNPEHLQKLDVLIENKNVKEINKWLKSANAEKQLYGIRAYKYLTTQGYKLSEEEKKLLDFVQQKDGDVSVCRGCSFGSEDLNV